MKDEKGAIIVEATISLSAFIFAIFTLLSIIDICYAQQKIAVALNSAAKEISQYSYLYSLTGLNEKQKELYNDTEGLRNDIDTTLNGIYDMSDDLAGESKALKSGELDFDRIMNEISDGKKTSKEIYSVWKNQLKDPKTLAIGMAKMAGNELWEGGKTIVGELLAKAFMEKNLVQSSDDTPEAFLKRMRIVPSGSSYMDGLDFKNSGIMINGSDRIQLVANYDIQVIRLLNLDVKLHFSQIAVTNAWSDGVSSKK